MPKEITARKVQLPERIATIIGEFAVNMSYHPIGEDSTLLKLTNCVNAMALPLIQKGNSPEEAFEKLNEAYLENALFDCLREKGGSGQRITLSLKSRTISFSNF